MDAYMHVGVFLKPAFLSLQWRLKAAKENTKMWLWITLNKNSKDTVGYFILVLFYIGVD